MRTIHYIRLAPCELPFRLTPIPLVSSIGGNYSIVPITRESNNNTRARSTWLSKRGIVSCWQPYWGLIVLAVRRADAGDLTTYTDLVSFQSATTSLIDVNFNGVTLGPSGYNNYFIPPGYTDAATGTNFTYLNANGDAINITSGSYYGPNFFPDNTLNESTSIPATSSEFITLPTSSTALGLYFSTFDQGKYVFTLSNGDTYTDSSTPAFGNLAFLGFTDTAAFTSLTISDPNMLLLDLKFGTAVPEPSSLTLLGIASVALAGYQWRRRCAAI